MTILNVFTNEKGQFGNPVGIVMDAKGAIPQNKRQAIALESGLSEVVFINDFNSGNISIFSPQNEIPFAGHAAVGVAHFIAHRYSSKIESLVSAGVEIPIWQEGNQMWVRGELKSAPPWNFEHVEKTDDIDSLIAENMSSKEHAFVWSWINKDKGIIRARTFAHDWGIPEDEANGSGSMLLASSLGRTLTIHHGKGSIIHARPRDNDYAEIGGLVKSA